MIRGGGGLNPQPPTHATDSTDILIIRIILLLPHQPWQESAHNLMLIRGGPFVFVLPLDSPPFHLSFRVVFISQPQPQTITNRNSISLIIIIHGI